MVVAITTTNGPPFYVDAELVDTPLTYTWSNGDNAVLTISDLSFHWHQSNRQSYAVTSVFYDGRVRKAFVHRLITQAPAGLLVDHKDHDTANNSSSNLRLATYVQNLANTKRRARKALRYKGVIRYQRKGGRFVYRAAIRYGGLRHYGPLFDTEEAAARWYDARALEAHGDFAVLNFAEEAAANG